MASLKTMSIKPITNAKINEATKTKTELFCNSEYFGQETLLRISSTDSLIKFVIFTICLYYFQLHGWRDSNSQPMVLETTTLPIELHPFTPPKRVCKVTIIFIKNKHVSAITETRFKVIVRRILLCYLS